MTASKAGDVVFVTGATGTVGEDLVARYLREAPSTRLALLVRERTGGSLDERVDRLVRFCAARGVPPRVFRDRVRMVVGDVEAPGCALSEGDAAWLGEHVTAVIHSAADVRFTLPLPSALRANRDGTSNVLERAAGWERVERVAVLSTVFVAGRRTGDIREHELEHAAGFVSGYEQSKYEAERLVRRRHDLPVAVYRLPALLGDSETGVVRRFGGIHRALQLYADGLVEALPGLPQSPVHMLPVDSAGAAVFELFEERFEPRTTAHVTAPPTGFLTFEAFLAGFRDAVEAATKGRRTVAPVPLVDGETFDEVRRFRRTRDRRRSRVLDALSHFVPQQLFPKQFVVSGPPPAAPPLSEYLPRVVAYCIASDWGRRPDAVEGA